LTTPPRICTIPLVNWPLLKKIVDYITLSTLLGAVGVCIHLIDAHRQTADEIESSKEWLHYDSAEILWLRGYEFNVPHLGPEPRMESYISDLKPNQQPTATMP
jgi:hypothetical protein